MEGYLQIASSCRTFSNWTGLDRCRKREDYVICFGAIQSIILPKNGWQIMEGNVLSILESLRPRIF
jgi:hypothetical protein